MSLPSAPTTQRSSKLFCPYRAIGSISDGAPFAINRLGDVTFITTTVGNSFQVFESEKLRLSIVAPPLIEGGRVINMAAQGSRTFIATERQIQVRIGTFTYELEVWTTRDKLCTGAFLTDSFLSSS